MSVGCRSSRLATTDLFARGTSGGVTRMPCSASAACSCGYVTPGSMTAMRLRRSIRRMRSSRRRSSITAPGTLGTVSPWKCGPPELTGTRGVAVSLAQATTFWTSSAEPGRTTAHGASRGAKLSSAAYSSRLAGSAATLSRPTSAASPSMMSFTSDDLPECCVRPCA